MKKVSILIVSLFIIGLMGCYSDPSAKVVGAWKSIEANRLDGKPETVIFDKVTAYLDGGVSFPVKYEERDGFIFVRRIDDNSIRFTIAIKGDKLEIDEGPGWGKYVYVRTTVEDVVAIRNAPSQLKSKPDSF
jgi:hypothetical protein